MAASGPSICSQVNVRAPPFLATLLAPVSTTVDPSAAASGVSGSPSGIVPATNDPRASGGPTPGSAGTTGTTTRCANEERPMSSVHVSSKTYVPATGTTASTRPSSVVNWNGPPTWVQVNVR